MEEIGGGDASKVPEESRGQMDAVGSGSPSTYASRLCYPLDLQGVSVAVGERHDLTNDLDYRISHCLDTETPVNIREQLTFDDACRVADGNRHSME